MNTTSLEVLEKSKLPHEQVHAILKAMELEIADRNVRLAENLATKGDLHALELKFSGLETRIEERFGKLEAKIEAQGSRMILWVFATAIAQVTLLYTIFGHRTP